MDSTQLTTRPSKGAVGNEEKKIAMRNNHAVAVEKKLADAAPFQVVLHLFGGEAKATLFLC
jgi:hypothetical protein